VKKEGHHGWLLVVLYSYGFAWLWYEFDLLRPVGVILVVSPRTGTLSVVAVELAHLVVEMTENDQINPNLDSTFVFNKIGPSKWLSPNESADNNNNMKFDFGNIGHQDGKFRWSL
jgi:hypothetical protein